MSDPASTPASTPSSPTSAAPTPAGFPWQLFTAEVLKSGGASIAVVLALAGLGQQALGQVQADLAEAARATTAMGAKLDDRIDDMQRDITELKISVATLGARLEPQERERRAAAGAEER